MPMEQDPETTERKAKAGGGEEVWDGSTLPPAHEWAYMFS